MVQAFNICIQFLTRKITFNEFGTAFSFSLFDVMLACLILGLFFRIFYTIYDR